MRALHLALPILAALAGCAPDPVRPTPEVQETGPPGETPAPQEWTTRTVAGQPGIAGLGPDGVDALTSPLYWPLDVVVGPDGIPHFMDFNNHRVRALAADGVVTSDLASNLTGGSEEWLAKPTSAVFGDERTMYLISSARVHRVDLDTHVMTPLCFPGFGDCEETDIPQYATGIALDGEGRLLMADSGRGTIMRLEPDDTLTTVAGTGVPGYDLDEGPALDVSLFMPHPDGLRADWGDRMVVANGVLYVADTGNDRILSIDLDTWHVTTLPFAIAEPADLAVGPDGTLYVPDHANHCIRYLRDGVPGVLAGECGTPGYFDGERGADTRFYGPFGVDVDADGNVYVADTDNQVIRVISLGD